MQISEDNDIYTITTDNGGVITVDGRFGLVSVLDTLKRQLTQEFIDSLPYEGKMRLLEELANNPPK